MDITVSTTYTANHVHANYSQTGVWVLYSGDSLEAAAKALYNAPTLDGGHLNVEVADVDADTRYAVQRDVWGIALLLETIDDNECIARDVSF
jgi:hypothetical protein